MGEFFFFSLTLSFLFFLFAPRERASTLIFASPFLLRTVLLRVQELQQRRGRVPLVAPAELVYLVDQDQGVGDAAGLEALDRLPRHRSHVRAAVALDLGDVSQAAWSTRDGGGSRGKRGRKIERVSFFCLASFELRAAPLKTPARKKRDKKKQREAPLTRPRRTGNTSSRARWRSTAPRRSCPPPGDRPSTGSCRPSRLGGRRRR